MTSTYFLTTAIDYVNGRPHLGHAYEKVLADALHRFHLSLGEDSYFLTGVDEHGQKVQQSAQARGVPAAAFCDEMAGHFASLWQQMRVEPSRFVRTTAAQHQAFVRDCLQRLYDRGEITFKTHRGFYSTRQEQFVTEKDCVDGKWPEIFGEVVETEEPNYFFALAPYQDWLRETLLERADWITPAFRRNEVLAALERPLGDLCISRPRSRLEWGIPLPFDEQFVTYVWFDALLNYASFATDSTGCNRWPADLHVIGKDILIPAHAVYWPIMLKALGMPLPKRYLVHGWWLNRGAKMSKSVGNAIDPQPYLERFGVDAIRYFLLREMALGQDADFTDEKVLQRYSSDLANDLGNLVQRSLSMLQRYRQGIVPAVAPEHVGDYERELQSDTVIQSYRTAMLEFRTHDALAAVWAYIQRVNQYVEQTAPFKLAKDPSQTAKLDTVLAHLVEAVRRLSVLVAAVMPETAHRIRTFLAGPEVAVAEAPLLSQAAWGSTLQGKTINPPQALFPRIEAEAQS